MMRKNNYFSKLKKWKAFASGFSLVELIIYMGMMMILISILSSIFSITLDTQLESTASTTVHDEGEFLLAKLTSDIRNSSVVSTPPAAGGQSSSLQLTLNGVANTYTLDSSGNLAVTNAAGTNVLNNYLSSISSLTFTRLGNVGGKNSISLSFRVTSRILERGSPRTQLFSTTVGTR
jgi:type II secretory pathway pseudopilin PulG